MWKPTGKVYTNVGYSWKPTGRTFTIVENTCLLTRIMSTNVVPPRKSIPVTPVKQTQPSSNKSGKPKNIKHVGSSSQSKTIGSKISNHSEPMQTWVSKVSTAPSSSRVYFWSYKSYSGYGDYQLGNVIISMVYYVEDGDGLLSGSRDINLYTISLDYMLKSSPISKQGLVRGLPKLKFKKNHLCSACSLGKSKNSTHKPKADDTNQEKLNLLHMDMCGPMRMDIINGKKYILVNVDDYS
ncbi:hypothetical protein Tco_0717635 [Tanacetum coccineum]